jgi:hypothetical protein
MFSQIPPTYELPKVAQPEPETPAYRRRTLECGDMRLEEGTGHWLRLKAPPTWQAYPTGVQKPE